MDITKFFNGISKKCGAKALKSRGVTMNPLNENNNEVNENTVPRSATYGQKTVVAENYTKVNNKPYYKRRFIDGSVELVRYDESENMWVFLCFAA